MLSIISNFGCDTGCPYCIWQGHPLSRFKTSYDEMDWGLLKDSILSLSQEKISVSGGGDPFFRYRENRDWWERLFSVCKRTGTEIDVHTSKIVLDPNILFNFSKYVLHLNYYSFLMNKNTLIKLSLKIPLRVVFVATAALSVAQVLEIEDFCKRHFIQLSFRQLVENGEVKNYLENVLDTESRHWHYIKQADYNIYFMPNNKIYKTYLMEEE